VALVRRLLEENPKLVRVENHGRKDPSGTPLHFAADAGQVRVIEVLLAFGADLETISRDRTPLQYAVWSGRREAAELLLARGARLDVYSAAGLGKRTELQALLDRNKGLACATGSFEKHTPLHWAAWGGDAEVTCLLLKHQADVSARMVWDYTPLHYAVMGGHSSVGKLLLEAGASLEVKNSAGETPLYVAVVHGRKELARMLLAAGARTDVRKDRFHPISMPIGGQPSLDTPLHQAVRFGDLPMVELLAFHGADAKARNRDGATPLDLWRQSVKRQTNLFLERVEVSHRLAARTVISWVVPTPSASSRLGR
jgi:ankyrin repeat protein